jgi:hypothetical protein
MNAPRLSPTDTPPVPVCRSPSHSALLNFIGSPDAEGRIAALAVTMPAAAAPARPATQSRVAQMMQWRLKVGCAFVLI